MVASSRVLGQASARTRPRSSGRSLIDVARIPHISVRLTLLAVLCWARTAEIIDGLVDLLIEVVDKIRTHAENRVEGELVRELKRKLPAPTVSGPAKPPPHDHRRFDRLGARAVGRAALLSRWQPVSPYRLEAYLVLWALSA
jgi:hypothetical protein